MMGSLQSVQVHLSVQHPIVRIGKNIRHLLQKVVHLELRLPHLKNMKIPK